MGMTHNEHKHIPSLQERKIFIIRELKKYFDSNIDDSRDSICFEYSTTTLLPIFFNFYPQNEIMIDFIKLLIETFNHIVIMRFTDFKKYEIKYKNVFEESKKRKINVNLVERSMKNRKLTKFLIERSRNVSKDFWSNSIDPQMKYNYITIFLSVKEYFDILEYFKAFGFKTISLHVPFFKLLNKFYDRLVPVVLQCEWIAIIKKLYNCKCDRGCYFGAILGSVVKTKCKAEIFKQRKENIFQENGEQSIKIKELNNSSFCNCKDKEFTDTEDLKTICIRLKKITLRPDFLFNSLLNFDEEIRNIKKALPYSLKLTLSSNQQNSIAEGILKHGCFLYDDLSPQYNNTFCYCHTCVSRKSKSIPSPVKLTGAHIKVIDSGGNDSEKQIVFNLDEFALFNFRDITQPIVHDDFAKINLVNIMEYERHYEQYGSNFYEFGIPFERIIQHIRDYRIDTDNGTDYEMPVRNILNTHNNQATTDSNSPTDTNQTTTDSNSPTDTNQTTTDTNSNDIHVEDIDPTNYILEDISSITEEIEQMSIDIYGSESSNNSHLHDLDSESDNDLFYRMFNLQFIRDYMTLQYLQPLPDYFSNTSLGNTENILPNNIVHNPPNNTVNNLLDNTVNNLLESDSTTNEYSGKIIIKDIQQRPPHVNIKEVKNDDIKIEISKFDCEGKFSNQFLNEKRNIYEKLKQNEMYLQPTEEELSIDDHLFKSIENQDNEINYQKKDMFRYPKRHSALLKHASILYPTFKKEEIYPFRRNHIVIPLAVMYFYREQWPLLVICKQNEKEEWEKIAIYCLKEWQKIDSAFETQLQEETGLEGLNGIQEVNDANEIHEEMKKKEEEEFKGLQEIYSQVNYESSEVFFNKFFHDFTKKIEKNTVIPVFIELPNLPKYDFELLMSWEDNKKESSMEDTSCFNDTSIKSTGKDKIRLSIIKGHVLSPFENATISRFLLKLEKSINEIHNPLDSFEKFSEAEIKEKLKAFLKEEYINLDSEKAKRINELKNKYKKLKETIIEPDCLSQKIKIMTTRAFNAEFLKQKKNLIKNPEIDFLNSNYCTIVTPDTNSINYASNFEEIAIRSKRFLLRTSPAKLLPLFHKIDLLLSNFRNYMDFGFSLKDIKLSAPLKDFDYLEILKLLFTNYKQFCFLGASLIENEDFQFYKFNIHEIIYGIIFILI